MVLRVTKDRRVMVVAGQPAYCKLQPAAKSRKAAGATAQLGALVSFTFGPAGEMYIAEVDRNNVHRVQQIMPDGEILHFAGADCECESRNCSCGATPPHGESALARDTKLYSVSSLTVTSDGVVHIADQGRLKILSAIPYLPQPDDQIEFQIASPETHEIYVFNKYGQHIMTKSILTGKTIYTFLYNVNTSFGKLNAVTDASGNKEVKRVDTQVAFLRDSGNRVHTIETARGHKCRVAVTTQGLFETLTDPDQLTTRLEYDAGGLLTSRADAAGRATFYLYDENGRLTDLVRASGRVTSLTFDLGPGGATVQAREEGAVDLLVTVRGTTVISQQGKIPSTLGIPKFSFENILYMKPKNFFFYLSQLRRIKTVIIL
ncbi:TENM2, partial [Cordylochernes scorpioides]